MLGPVLEELARENPGARIVKVDVDRSPNVAVEYKIEAIPALQAVSGRQGGEPVRWSGEQGGVAFNAGAVAAGDIAPERKVGHVLISSRLFTVRKDNPLRRVGSDLRICRLRLANLPTYQLGEFLKGGCVVSGAADIQGRSSLRGQKPSEADSAIWIGNRHQQCADDSDAERNVTEYSEFRILCAVVAHGEHEQTQR